MKSIMADEGRAEALRRHRRNPERVADIKAKVRAGMLADWGGKVTASLAGVSHSAACRWANALGFHQMYVTAEERAHLLARRAGGAT